MQKYFFIALVFVFLGAGCFSVPKEKTDNFIPVQITPTTTTEDIESYLVSDEKFLPFALWRSQNVVDLVRVDGDTRTVIISDVIGEMRNTQRLPDNFTSYSLTDEGTQIDNAVILSSFDQQKYLILQGFSGWDGFLPRPLWKVDTEAKTMSYLTNINEQGPMIYISYSMISPNNTKIAIEGSCIDIFLYDFVNDIFEEKKMPLSNNQSLCKYAESLSPFGQLIWLDDNNLQYEVYDSSDIEIHRIDGTPMPFLFTKTFKL